MPRKSCCRNREVTTPREVRSFLVFPGTKAARTVMECCRIRDRELPNYGRASAICRFESMANTAIGNSCRWLAEQMFIESRQGKFRSFPVTPNVRELPIPSSHQMQPLAPIGRLPVRILGFLRNEKVVLRCPLPRLPGSVLNVHHGRN